MDAAERIAALFEDGGKGLLGHSGVATSWQALIEQTPRVLYSELPADDTGVALLRRLRDYWIKVKNPRAALAFTRALIAVLQRIQGESHPDTMVEVGALGGLALRVGQLDEAEQMLQRAYASLRTRLGAADPRVAVVASNAGLLLLKKGDLRGAEALLHQAYKILKHQPAEKRALSCAQLAEIRLKLGDREGALPLLREAWTAYFDAFGEQDARTIARAQTLAKALNDTELHAEAAPVLKHVYRFLSKHGTPEQLAQVCFDIGVAYLHTYKGEEALRHLEEALRITRELSAPGRPHPALPHRITQYAKLMIERRRIELAEGLFREALEAERVLFGENSVEVGGRLATLGYYCARTSRPHEAVGWLDAAASILRSTAGDRDPRTHKCIDLLTQLLYSQAETARAMRDYRLARQLLARAEMLAVPVLGADHERVKQIRVLQAQRLGAR